MSDARDPYDVLGVPRWASTQEIRAAYVDRARRAHPDLVGTQGLEVMRILNEAWDVLKDPVRRAEYDVASRGPGGGAGGGASARADPSSAESTSSKPFWTGAAGPPPGRPSGPVLDFGIYAGWSLGEVLRIDRGWLAWARDRRETAAYRKDIVELLGPLADDDDGGRRRGR